MLDWLANILTGGRLEELEGQAGDARMNYTRALAVLETANAELDLLLRDWRQFVDKKKSHDAALRELWRHSADRARTWEHAAMLLAALREAEASDLADVRKTLGAITLVGMTAAGDRKLLQAHAVRLYGDCRFSDELQAETQKDFDWFQLESRKQRDAAQADLERQRLWASSLQTVQGRIMAERDMWFSKWVEALGHADAWEQTAGELQAEVDRRERTIERQEARIKALEEGLAKAQKNDRRGPDGRFARSGQ